MEKLENHENYNKVWRVATAGYPYHTPEELGVSDWRSAYQATKYAIYCVLEETTVDNFYGDDAEGAAIATAIRNLYNVGMNGTSTYRNPAATINKSGNITLSGEYYIQNYIVSSNVDISSFNVSLANFPNGTKTTNTNGVEKTTFNPNETVQLRIPKNALETVDINGILRVDVNTKSYAVFYRKNI